MTNKKNITRHRGFFSKIARKHGVDSSYVWLINSRVRKANTDVAKAIVKDLKQYDKLYNQLG